MDSKGGVLPEPVAHTHQKAFLGRSGSPEIERGFEGGGEQITGPVSPPRPPAVKIGDRPIQAYYKG